MDRQQLIEFLGLSAEATDEEIAAALAAMKAKADEKSAEENDDTPPELTPEEQTKKAEEERDQAINSANAVAEKLRTVREDAANLRLDSAIASGRITKAERADWFAKLTGEKREDAINSLAALKPKLSTTPINLERSRKAVGTEAERRVTVENAVAKIQRERGCSRTDAWNAAKADPELKPVFEAMKQPQRLED